MRLALPAAVLATALLAAPAHATNGIRMIGFGPVQNAMGGASVGATLDAASVLTNPAGIAGMGGRLDFGTSVLSADVEYQASSPAPGVVADPSVQGSERGPAPIPAFGLVLPIDDRLTFGLGAYGIAGLGTDYPFNLAGNTAYSNYSQMRFAPGLAARLGPVSVGATVNLMYSTLGYTLGSTGFGQVPHDDANAFQVGATVGLRVEATDWLSVGLAYESKGYGPAFEYDTPAFSFDPDGPGPAGAVDVPAGREELRFEPPPVLSAGLAWRPLEAVLVAADVQWIGWSGVLGDGGPEFETANPSTLPLDLDWNDQVVVKLGVQVSPTDTLALRVGWNYGKHPLAAGKAIQNVALPAVAEHHVTGGVGWSASRRLTVNVGAMWSPEAELTGTDPAFATTYEVRMSQLGVDAGIAYTF